MSGEVSLLDYVYVILRRRWMITSLVVCITGLAVIIAFILPMSYQSRATILPPEGKSSGLNLGALLSSTNISIPGLGGMSQIGGNSDLFVQQMNSRTIAEKIIAKFDLELIYGAPDHEEALKILGNSTTIKIEKAGMISILAEMPTPQMAADVANAYVEELDRFNRENNTTGAKNSRKFIEQRLNGAKTDMLTAMKQLQKFQEKHQLISLTEQAKVAVEAAAEVTGQLRSLEIELSLKRRVLSHTHPSVVQSQMQVEELENLINRLKYGDQEIDNTSADGSQNIADLNPPFSQMPSLQYQLGHLMLNARIQQAIVEILQQQYEYAKIEEIRDTPTVRRLDVAVPPLTRSKPQRTLIVVSAGIISLFVGVILAFLLEYRQHLKNDHEVSRKLSSISSLLSGDAEKVQNLFSRRNKTETD